MTFSTRVTRMVPIMIVLIQMLLVSTQTCVQIFTYIFSSSMDMCHPMPSSVDRVLLTTQLR